MILYNNLEWYRRISSSAPIHSLSPSPPPPPPPIAPHHSPVSVLYLSGLTQSMSSFMPLLFVGQLGACASGLRSTILIATNGDFYNATNIAKKKYKEPLRNMLWIKIRKKKIRGERVEKEGRKKEKDRSKNSKIR